MSDTQHRIHPGGPLHGGQLRASCDEREVVLDEGRFHQGSAAVVGMVAVKG